MKKKRMNRQPMFAILISSMMLLTACEKIKLNLPVLGSSKKKVTDEIAGFDWPRWRGPDGNGISKETEWNPEALANGPKVMWRTNIGFGYSNVVMKNNRLYTMDQVGCEGILFCFNA